MASPNSNSPTEAEDEEPLSSRSSYFSAIDHTDTSNIEDDCVEEITTTKNNGDERLATSSKQAANGMHANNSYINTTPSPLKQKQRASSTRLERHQKRALGSFMESPSQSNWDELVQSMKKCISGNYAPEESSGAAGSSRHVPRPPVESARKLSYEPEPIHSVKDKHFAANCNGNASLHESAEHFAIEHGIFLKAVLQLLHEKERPVPSVHQQQPLIENRFDDIQDVIKIGSLKKASKRVKGRWNVKFVEIRKGE